MIEKADVVLRGPKHGPDYEGRVPVDKAINMNGTLILPCDDFGVSVDTQVSNAGGSRSHFVAIFCARQKVGFQFCATPEGARAVAKALLEGADEVDAKIAGQAAAAIDAARASGGRS